MCHSPLLHLFAPSSLLHHGLFASSALQSTGGRYEYCKTPVQRVDIRYLDNRSFVRRMMNLLTNVPSSFNLASLSAFSLSVASASRPRRILSSKFFLKSPREPRYSGLAKFRRAKYSERSFWIGGAGRMTRRCKLSAVRDWKVRVSDLSVSGCLV